jgi:hypothetical protein
MHPFVNDTADLTDSELEEKIQSASRNYWRTTNPQIQSQIQMIIETYKQELETRKVKQRLEQQNNDDPDLDNLINVS